MTITQISLLALCALVLFFLMLAYIIRINRKAMTAHCESFENLSALIPGSVSKYSKLLDQPSFSGMFSSHKYSFTYARGLLPSRWFELNFERKSANGMKLYFYSGSVGRVLFMKRIYTGDHMLDQYFIYSNKPEEAKRFLSDYSRLTAIKNLIWAGWDPPNIIGKLLKTSTGVPVRIDPQWIKKTLENILILGT